MSGFDLQVALDAAAQVEETGDYFTRVCEHSKAAGCYNAARRYRREAHGTARQIQRQRQRHTEARRKALVASTMTAIYGGD